ncbi:hypothetical protein GGR54DRAFT_350584 [Hypoxylon sp. NC1633]|nr:hypothetical protein GGR54DRAFT_350584 [Hypoxylon sp. NC1633]
MDQKFSFYGEDIELVVETDEQVSTTNKDIKVRRFQGRRAHAPDLLAIDNAEIKEGNFERRYCISNLARPASDWGLGCFGHSTKLVDTGKGETTELFWTDFHETKTGVDLFEGLQSWKGDEEWIRLQRLTQKNAQDKTEQDLIDFHQAQQAILRQPRRDINRSGRSETGGPEEGRNDTGTQPVLDGDRIRPVNLDTGGLWVLHNFEDWIEETDFIESHASLGA